MMGWLKQIGKLELKKAWSEVVTRLIGAGGGLVFSRTGKPKPDFQKTCVPLQPAHGQAPLTETEEKKIVCALLTDLNNLYSLDLDTDPNFSRQARARCW
jgi:hypothetical protein